MNATVPQKLTAEQQFEQLLNQVPTEELPQVLADLQGIAESAKTGL